MKDALLIFTFSPVQGFIKASRRTRDFFTGSYILSWLTFRTMYKLIQEKGISPDDFVYPVLNRQPLWEFFTKHDTNTDALAVANFPNRFVLKLNYSNHKDLPKELIRMFKYEWKNIYEYVFETFKSHLSNKGIETPHIKDQFVEHVENYFTPFAVILKDTPREHYESVVKDIPELDQKDPYGYTYDLAERILGARKTFRTYRGFCDEGSRDSCSVCGERKSLALDWNVLKEDYDLQGDKLCGVCLVKRLGYKYFVHKFNEDERVEDLFKHFPSTREIAGIRFKETILNDPQALESYRNYVSKLPEGLKIKVRTYPVKSLRKSGKSEFLRYDAQIYHRNEWFNLKREYEELPNLPTNDVPKHTNSYFAIIYADGDHMGKWLGLRKEIRKEELTEEFHRRFSKAISEYALSDVLEIFEDRYPSRLVYAGGDDVFAFTHPWYIPDILDELRRRFSSKLEHFKTINNKEPSISAGIVIGHAKSPLKRLISNVDEAERRAKNDFGRNAFVIRVVVRSGSTWDFGGKWEYGNFITMQVFKETMMLLGEGGFRCHLSSNFIYDIRDMLQTFSKTNFNEEHLEIFKALFIRAFRRKFRCNANSEESKRILESRIDYYMDFLEAMLKEHTNMNMLEVVYNFTNMFYIARFIVKEAKL